MIIPLIILSSLFCGAESKAVGTREETRGNAARFIKPLKGAESKGKHLGRREQSGRETFQENYVYSMQRADKFHTEMCRARTHLSSLAVRLNLKNVARVEAAVSRRPVSMKFSFEQPVTLHKSRRGGVKFAQKPRQR